MTRFVAGMLLVGPMVLSASLVSGQNYPYKAVRIVTSEVGGSVDSNARLMADGLSSALGQPVIVENRAGLVIPPEIVAKAAPDGYTLLVIGSYLWIGPLMRKTSYDPVRDFLPISTLARSPIVLVLHPSLPVKSVKELIALAKARPGELNNATSVSGGSLHLASALFNSMANVNIVQIPYKVATAALKDLITGQVQLCFSSPPPVIPHLRSGILRPLAVTSAESSALFPDLPTIAASGLPGYDASVFQGVWVPAGTPAPIVNRLNQEIARFLNRPDTKERFLRTGVEAAPSTPEQFAARINSEIIRMGKVIKDAGIRAE